MGGGGNDDIGGLVGQSGDFGRGTPGTVTASYGFGTATGGISAQPRSDDAADEATVTDACDITQANSSIMTGMTGMPDNRWDTTQWNFGTPDQRPVVRDSAGAIVSGQTERGC